MSSGAAAVEVRPIPQPASAAGSAAVVEVIVPYLDLSLQAALDALDGFIRNLTYDQVGGLVAILGTKAPKDSPEFTGTPLAPTAAPGTNSRQIASTAFVSAAIGALTAGSPAQLDTFLEVYNRFLADEGALTALTNTVATKAAAARKISGGGLATGGGDLTDDRTITVPKASTVQAQAGTDDTVALTPASGSALLNALLVAALQAIAPSLPTAPGAPGAAHVWLNGDAFSFS